MSLKDLVLANRSYRRFDAKVPLDEPFLRSLIELARVTPSATNMQPIKYLLSCSPEWNRKIFETLAWAGYLRDVWPGPAEHERPAAYIVLLIDTTLRESADTDIGIAAQTILLGAVERGYGGCMLGAIRRDMLAERLALPKHLKISLVIALGKPTEKIVLEDAKPGGSIKYYRDPDQTHHVPKRTLDELIYKVYR